MEKRVTYMEKRVTYMRKRVAFFISMILFITSIPNISFASSIIPEITFEESDKGLKENRNENVLSEPTIKDNEEVGAVEWNIPQEMPGKYELSYFVETMNGLTRETKQVKLQFEVESGTTERKVKLTTGLEKEGTPLPVVHKEHKRPYIDQWVNIGTGATDLTSTALQGTIENLILGSSKTDETETSFMIDNIHILIKLSGTKVKVFTNFIKKGNITDFVLKAGNTLEEIGRVVIFNGVQAFKVTPVHLYKEGSDLKTTDVIGAPGLWNEEMGNEAGSRPGIKVSIRQLQRVYGNKFENVKYNTLDEKSKISAVINLWPKFTTDNTPNQEGLSLKFILGDTSKVITKGYDQTEKLSETRTDEDGNIYFYVVDNLTIKKDTTAPVTLTKNEAIEWNSLSSSSLVGASIKFLDGIIEGVNPPIYSEQSGYTYLHYTAKRTADKEITFSIDPYKIVAEARYYIYAGNSPQELQNTEKIVGQDNIEASGAYLLRYIHNPKAGSEQNIINLPIPIAGAQTGPYYKIKMVIGTQTLDSQVIRYDYRDGTIPGPVTNIERIDNLYVLPHELEKDETAQQNTQPDAIGFDLEWKAPQDVGTLLEGGKLYYELFVRKDNKAETQGELIKIFEVSKEEIPNSVPGANGKKPTHIVVRPYAPYDESGEGYLQPQERYISSTNPQRFKMENVKLKNIKNSSWQKLMMPEGYLSAGRTEYPEAEQIISGMLSESDYKVPGIYFLSMRAVYAPNNNIGEAKDISAGDECNLKSISLDETKGVIPVPFSFGTTEGTSTTEKNVTINWNNVDIQEYVRLMLKPGKWFASPDEAEKYRGTYQIYLYQNSDISEGALLNTIPQKIDSTTPPAIILDENLKKGMRGTNGGAISREYELDGLIGGEFKELDIQNLDPNQVYYVRIRVKLQSNNENLLVRERYSELSKVFSFTTSMSPVEPRPDEETPPTPEEFKVVASTNTTADATWGRPKFLPRNDDWAKVEYEIIRTTEIKLPENVKLENGNEIKLKDNKLKMQEIINTISNGKGLTLTNKDVQAYRRSGEKVLIFDTTLGWHNTLSDQDTNNFESLKDKNLLPNTIYYYYIRTVYKTELGESMSDWIMHPVTTKTVERPKNLQVDKATKTDIQISFEAAIPAEAIVGKQANAQYDFDIRVQSEMDASWKQYEGKLIRKETEKTLAGYTRFIYLIEGLKPGKRYNIKVAVIDKTQGDIPGKNPQSAYSDIVVARTEFDELDQEKDEKYAQYLKRYNDEVEKLRRKPYWTVEESKYAGAYKYRSSYINAEMALQKDYQLVGGEDLTRLHYYLPANMLDAASSEDVIITVKLGNQTINIRPYTLTQENPDIKEAIEKVNSRLIADYYIELIFSANKVSGTVNGENVLSSEIEIDMQLVYMSQKDMFIEDDIMKKLNDLIIAEEFKVIKRLEAELKGDRIEEAILTRIIEDAVNNIRKDHAKEVERLLDRNDIRSIMIGKIERPILIFIQLDSFSVNAYYKSGAWEKIESFAVMSGFALEAAKLGSYVFTGQKALIDLVPELAPYQTLIAKYTLGDFFKIDAYSINVGATKEQVYGSVARVIGAKRGTDYINYLKQNGFKGITSIGLNKTMRQDEAIYIIMQGYEKIYNKQIASINIKNKQMVQNIGAFQPMYRNYIYAAVELKVVVPRQSQVLPSQQMSAKDIIKMLNSIVKQ